METISLRIGEATYSPDDNKIRIKPFNRLDKETYARVRGAGYIWAPKQGIFVAPMWTPQRQDLAVELCGEIGDEDTTLEERAEQRAERFEDYSEKRGQEAESAKKHVDSICDGIPMGQPILIGHHSQRHAERDAKKIENGMRRAIKLWETSEYWTRRAAGAIRHAKYKELPSVRARRIKRIEADLRRQERYKAEAQLWLDRWNAPGLTLERAKAFANFCRLLVCRRDTEGSSAEYWSAYDVLQPDETRYKNCPSKTPEECREAANKAYPREIQRNQVWIDHYKNRIAYENAMLADAGGRVEEKNVIQKGGAVKSWVSSHKEEWLYVVRLNKVSVSLGDNWGNGGRNFSRVVPFDKIRAVMTAAEVSAAREAGTLYENAYKTGFIVRSAAVTITKKEDIEQKTEETETAQARQVGFEAMKQSLKAGIQTVSAPQLFPTPPDLARRMVELADISEYQTVLEPSAGTGAIVDAIVKNCATSLTCVEINSQLCGLLRGQLSGHVINKDFLEIQPPMEGNATLIIKELPEVFYDRILMNPPFENGADIKHIEHALKFLKGGGRLVAICANGPRQRAKLKTMAENSGGTWEDLPQGTFANQGTGVNTALLVIEK